MAYDVTHGADCMVYRIVLQYKRYARSTAMVLQYKRYARSTAMVFEGINAMQMMNT